MPSRISDNSMTERLSYNLKQLEHQSLKAHTELSSGQKVERASDDPSAMAQVMPSVDKKRDLAQFAANNEAAMAVSTATLNVLQAFKDNLNTRAQEIADYSSGLTDPGAKTAYAKELDELIKHGVQLLNSKHEDEYLLGGDNASTKPFVATEDANGTVLSVSYAGSTTARKYDVGEGVRLSPQLNPSQSTAYAGYLTSMISLRDALNAGADVSTARTQLIADETPIISDISGEGAKRMRLELSQSRDRAHFKELDQRIGKLVDADVIDASIRFKNLQEALGLSLQTSARMMQQNIFNYL